jgi:hypothetical protein
MSLDRIRGQPFTLDASRGSSATSAFSKKRNNLQHRRHTDAQVLPPCWSRGHPTQALDVPIAARTSAARRCERGDTSMSRASERTVS